MDEFFQLDTITVKVNEKHIKCAVMEYSAAKVKDLREFGYTDLTEESVQESVWRIVKGEKLTDVIDHFIKDDIVTS